MKTILTLSLIALSTTAIAGTTNNNTSNPYTYINPVNKVDAKGGDSNAEALGLGVALSGSGVAKSGNSKNVLGQDTKVSSKNNIGQDTKVNSSLGQSADNAVTITEEHNYRRIPANTAYAPSLVAGARSCAGSISSGGGTSLFQGSFGMTTELESCVRDLVSRRLEEMGMHKSAKAIFCFDEEAKAAFRMTGELFCPEDEETKVVHEYPPYKR